MIIIKINEKSSKIKVEDINNRITNKDKTLFFTESVIPTNTVDDYEEVGYEIWGLFVNNEMPTNKVEELNNEITILKNEKQKLEDNFCILKNENTRQNAVIENMMLDILDLMYQDDLNDEDDTEL